MFLCTENMSVCSYVERTFSVFLCRENMSVCSYVGLQRTFQYVLMYREHVSVFLCTENMSVGVS